jgi:hypothetical protein
MPDSLTQHGDVIADGRTAVSELDSRQQDFFLFFATASSSASHPMGTWRVKRTGRESNHSQEYINKTVDIKNTWRLHLLVYTSS